VFVASATSPRAKAAKVLRAGSDLFELLLDLTPAERAKLVRSLSLDEREQLMWCWEFWARPDQVWRPGDERDTFYLAGRGWGKTRVGAEAVRWVADHPEWCGGEIAIAGRTAGHRNRDMLYGTSGLLTIMPPWRTVEHRKSDGEIVWTRSAEVSGSAYHGRETTCRARLMSGDVPDSFRGPGFGFAWTDELPHWARAAEAWTMLEFTLRGSGVRDDKPRTINTTTPLPTPALLERLFECDSAGRPEPDVHSPSGFRVLPHVRVVHGDSYQNAANLSADYIATTLARHKGTRLGAQEIGGGILLDIPGALWRYGWIRRIDDAPQLDKIVIGIDPAGSAGNDSAETGIIGAGLVQKSSGFYLLGDRSGLHSPLAWARAAIDLFDELGADLILAERNFGGDMVRSQIELVALLPDVVAARRARGTTREVKVEDVTARGSKSDRARTVAGLWEQGRVFHVGDSRRWVDLEHQQTHWDPTRPRRGQRSDRLDAAVHAIRYLADAPEAVPQWQAGDSPEFWRSVREGILSK
jgi:phage terminase large subunit-like protein